MKFSDLIKLVEKASIEKDLENVVKFTQKHKDKSSKELKALIKKQFPNLDDDDITLALELI